MKNHLTDKLCSALLACVLLLFSAGASAQGGNYSSDVDLEPIIALIDKGDFEEAINRLHDALDVNPDNADIMSLLGFSYRKTQNYVDALTFYEWALRADPQHRGANEYLGELYLETNRLDKAVEQLQILDNLCSSCKEYSKLKKMIDSYQQSASNS